jgi:hypothetical protein
LELHGGRQTVQTKKKTLNEFAPWSRLKTRELLQDIEVCRDRSLDFEWFGGSLQSLAIRWIIENLPDCRSHPRYVANLDQGGHAAIAQDLAGALRTVRGDHRTPNGQCLDQDIRGTLPSGRQHEELGPSHECEGVDHIPRHIDSILETEMFHKRLQAVPVIAFAQDDQPRRPLEHDLGKRLN